jgi:hypothetical protein
MPSASCAQVRQHPARGGYLESARSFDAAAVIGHHHVEAANVVLDQYCAARHGRCPFGGCCITGPSAPPKTRPHRSTVPADRPRKFARDFGGSDDYERIVPYGSAIASGVAAPPRT